MEYQKSTNLLGNIPDQVPTKKWVKIYDESGGTYKDITNKLCLKHQC